MCVFARIFVGPTFGQTSTGNANVRANASSKTRRLPKRGEGCGNERLVIAVLRMPYQFVF